MGNSKILIHLIDSLIYINPFKAVVYYYMIIHFLRPPFQNQNFLTLPNRFFSEVSDHIFGGGVYHAVSLARQSEDAHVNSIFFVVPAIDTKQLPKVLGISQGLVIVSPLSWDSTVYAMESTVFRKIWDLIPFHVFLMLFQFVSKYFIHNKPVCFSSQGWRVNFYAFVFNVKFLL